VNLDDIRLPPHSTEAEQSVLGGLLIDASAFDRVADVVREGDFYRSDHRAIFRAISRLADRGQPADVVTVGEDLEAHGELEHAGGAAYLLTLTNNTASAANVRRYAEIVREHVLRRDLLVISGDIAQRAYERAPINETIEFAQARVMAITDSRANNAPRRAAEFTAAVVDEIEERIQHAERLSGLATGFVDLDRRLDGLRAGDLIVVAARPSVGKTTFALNIAQQVAIDGDKPVFFNSLEMSGKSLTRRLMAGVSGIPLWRTRDGKMDREHWDAIANALKKIHEAPLHFDDVSLLTISELCARARSHKRRHGLALLVVDYLQLLQAPGAENRTQEITKISAALKSLARQLSAPVVALSQLNRAVESRSDKRPTIGDLRDSGAIEQDADVILMLYRDDAYNRDSPAKGTAEIIVAKHREGETGTVRLAFRPELARFENLNRGWKPRTPAPVARGFD
jgi:replicative DNA helicase